MMRIALFDSSGEIRTRAMVVRQGDSVALGGWKDGVVKWSPCCYFPTLDLPFKTI